eukprot:EG_transcript_39361
MAHPRRPAPLVPALALAVTALALLGLGGDWAPLARLWSVPRGVRPASSQSHPRPTLQPGLPPAPLAPWDTALASRRPAIPLAPPDSGTPGWQLLRPSRAASLSLAGLCLCAAAVALVALRRRPPWPTPAAAALRPGAGPT